jgi:hypothetical protein
MVTSSKVVGSQSSERSRVRVSYISMGSVFPFYLDMARPWLLILLIGGNRWKMRIGKLIKMGSLVGKIYGEKRTWKRMLRIIRQNGAAFKTAAWL